jgi:hypothetical protein
LACPGEDDTDEEEGELVTSRPMFMAYRTARSRVFGDGPVFFLLELSEWTELAVRCLSSSESVLLFSTWTV